MDVDRVARRRDERRVAGLDERPHEVDEALLGAHRRDHLGLGIQLDSEAAPVEVGAGRAELRDALRGGVAVVVRLRGGLLELRDGHLGRGQVGIAEPEVDDVVACAAQLERQLADHREHVRRQPVEPAEGERHRPWSSGSPLRASAVNDSVP